MWKPLVQTEIKEKKMWRSDFR